MLSYLKPLKWSTSLQGYILSSFFYGYIFTQLPGGFLSNKYGGNMKNFIAVEIFNYFMFKVENYFLDWALVYVAYLAYLFH